MPIQDASVSSLPVLDDQLTSQQWRSLESCAVSMRFAIGRRLAEQDQRVDRFFLIQSGEVALEAYSTVRGPHLVLALGAGEWLGTAWPMAGARWPFDVRALTITDALVFNVRSVQELCAKEPALADALLRRFYSSHARRLEAAEKQVLALYAGRQ